MVIGLVAHDTKKELMQNFCIAYKNILSKHELYSTGDTGRIVEDVTNLSIHKFIPGKLGGCRQMCAQIDCNEMDAVFILRNATLPDEDFDNIIVNYLCDEFKKESGVDIKNDPAAMQRIKDEAEKAKKELSSATSTDINLPFLTADADGPKHFEHTLTRAKLEELVSDLLDRLEAPVRNALKDAKLDTKDIDEIVMVGGMTRMPAVVEKVKKIFGKGSFFQTKLIS